jgi:D-glutamate N-acetyltransferase
MRYQLHVPTPPDRAPGAFPYSPEATVNDRRLAILAEGQFTFHSGKTAAGVLRYGTDPVVAVIDSTNAGRLAGDVLDWLGRGATVPVVASLDEALRALVPPTTLLIGIAPTGGKLPAAWRSIILGAIRAGLDVESGLHTFVGDDPELAAAALDAGVRIVDHRRPPERMETAVGRRHGPGKRVILTVATDCALGKMSVALELRRAALEAGRSAALVPTGQTGMMIEGWGVAVDRVVADFLQGTCEDLVAQGEERGDWVFVEGQGSLDHPAYSSVTLGLIHGGTPHAMVMVHKPGLAAHDFDHLPDRSFPIAELGPFIDLHERVAALVAPSKVVAVALNTMLIPDEAEARRIVEETARRTGLPVDDPVRFGSEPLWRAIEPAVDSLPWVEARATT